MTRRRWAALAGLVGAVAWLHGWSLAAWEHGVRASDASTASARPAAVRVVWPAPPAAAAPTAAPTGVEPIENVAAPKEAIATSTPRADAAADTGRQHAAEPAAVAQRPAVQAAPQAEADAATAPAESLFLVSDTLHTVAAGDVAAADASPPATAPRQTVPTYRTRVPPAATVSYRMSRSGLAGTGELDWRPDAGSYSLRLEGQLPLIGTLITQTSRGGFDDAGLAPERFTDKRLRRGEQAASFRRVERTVSFSGQSPDVPLTPGVQDRLSVMVQLAAIAAAWRKPPAVGTQFQVRVIGARGDASVWSLRFEGADTVETPEGAVPALHFQREGNSPQDTRAEFWLDPARSHLPVRVRITDGGSDPFELLRLK